MRMPKKKAVKWKTYSSEHPTAQSARMAAAMLLQLHSRRVSSVKIVKKKDGYAVVYK